MLYYQLIRQLFKTPQTTRELRVTQPSKKARFLPIKAFPSTKVAPLYPLLESAASWLQVSNAVMRNSLA